MELSQDDQLILIKVGFLEVWLVHVSRLATEHGLTMWDGTTFTRSQLSTMYDVSIASLVATARPVSPNPNPLTSARRASWWAPSSACARPWARWG